MHDLVVVLQDHGPVSKTNERADHLAIQTGLRAQLCAGQL